MVWGSDLDEVHRDYNSHVTTHPYKLNSGSPIQNIKKSSLWVYSVIPIKTVLMMMVMTTMLMLLLATIYGYYFLPPTPHPPRTHPAPTPHPPRMSESAGLRPKTTPLGYPVTGGRKSFDDVDAGSHMMKFKHG